MDHTTGVPEQSPLSIADSSTNPTVSEGVQHSSGQRYHSSNEDTTILPAAAAGGFQPPFKGLIYQAAVSDLRDESRATSPRPSLSKRNSGIFPPGILVSLRKRKQREANDPINTGLLDVTTAGVLLNL
jgi:hypothetical protein